MNIKLLLLVFIGCGFGGVSRYLVAIFTNSIMVTSFPYATLFVNVTGSFLMGIGYEIISVKYHHAILSEQLRALLLVGFLGGYTTFSSFSIETFNLIKSGETLSATMYIILSAVLCIIFASLGVMFAK